MDVTTTLTAVAAQCHGKQVYETWDAAARVLKRRRRKKYKHNIYRCPHCRHFHIGEQYNPPMRKPYDRRRNKGSAVC